MCGIFCSCKLNDSSVSLQELNYTKDFLTKRGPNASSEKVLKLNENWFGFFAGFTLWTQGASPTLQPLVSTEGSAFLWNGDDYTLNDKNKSNDTEHLFSKVVLHGIKYLTNVNGPYSFIYFDASEKALWFGRDVFGRRSLLWSLAEDAIQISSVYLPSGGDGPEVSEVPHYALYKLEFSSQGFSLNVHPWYHMGDNPSSVPIPYTIGECVSHQLLKFRYQDWPDPSGEEFSFIRDFGCEPEMKAGPVFVAALLRAPFVNIVKELRKLIFNSVERRIKTQPDYCKECILGGKVQQCCHPRTCILFSGGLDSAVLALVSHSFVPEDEPIDLFNVSFQRSPSHEFSQVPDRMNGLSTLNELRELCPERIWNFIEIDISMEELNFERKQHISKLIYPLNSILDDSLGCALWFAARGQGVLNGASYTSPARVALLGMGADELFGGYTNHRKAFVRDGWKGLSRQLREALARLGERNLGRDDRVVSHHGLVSRAPYLDEEFVAYVCSLPPWERCFLPPILPVGIGDKFILRLLAWELGLKKAASLPKKALQFGSRIANPKEKGHLTSERLCT